MGLDCSSDGIAHALAAPTQRHTRARGFFRLGVALRPLLYKPGPCGFAMARVIQRRRCRRPGPLLAAAGLIAVASASAVAADGGGGASATIREALTATALWSTLSDLVRVAEAKEAAAKQDEAARKAAARKATAAAKKRKKKLKKANKPKPKRLAPDTACKTVGGRMTAVAQCMRQDVDFAQCMSTGPPKHTGKLCACAKEALAGKGAACRMFKTPCTPAAASAADVWCEPERFNSTAARALDFKNACAPGTKWSKVRGLFTASRAATSPPFAAARVCVCGQGGHRELY